MSTNVYVFMKKDVEHIGMKGSLLKVSSGYANNFLIPKGFARIVSEKEVGELKKKNKNIESLKSQVASKTSILCENIKKTSLTIKQKAHDDGKLYGAVPASLVAAELKSKGFSVSKSQIEFNKSIKKIGQYVVTVKLSSKLKPELNLKVIEE